LYSKMVMETFLYRRRLLHHVAMVVRVAMYLSWDQLQAKLQRFLVIGKRILDQAGYASVRFRMAVSTLIGMESFSGIVGGVVN